MCWQHCSVSSESVFYFSFKNTFLPNIIQINTMFKSSQRICTCLVNHWIISKSAFSITANSRSKIQAVTSNLVGNKVVPNFGERPLEDQAKIGNIAKLINEYPNSESINWEELKLKLNEINVKEHNSAILQACLRLQNLEAGISFYNHIIKSGKELSILELVFFIKLFHRKKDEISKYETVVKYVYDNIKVYMKSSTVIQNYIIDLISEIPSCFIDFVTNTNDDLVQHKISLIKKALELKNLEIVYQLMQGVRDISVINEIFDLYIKCLSQMVIENKFSPDMITSFVEFCESKIHIISHKNFTSLMNNLVSTLNSVDKNNVWTIKKCSISDESVCSNCNSKLIDKCISKSELASLKEAFLGEAGLVDKNVYLSTSENELNRFLRFLDTCEPYDVVFDGLNIIFSKKTHWKEILSGLLKYFLDKQSRVLIIARVHAKHRITTLPLLKQSKYRNNCQYFFTENWSDDDVFVLYAALHGGLGTYFCSRDFHNSYASRLQDFKHLFVRWKLYHQYLPTNFDIMPPRPYLGLSQLTVSENDRLVWHISHSDTPVCEGKLNAAVPLKWICLQAQKRLGLHKNNFKDVEKELCSR